MSFRIQLKADALTTPELPTSEAHESKVTAGHDEPWRSLIDVGRHLNRLQFLWICRFILPAKRVSDDLLQTAHQDVVAALRPCIPPTGRDSAESSLKAIVQGLHACETEWYATEFWLDLCFPFFNERESQLDEIRLPNQLQVFLQPLAIWIRGLEQTLNAYAQMLFRLGQTLDRIVRPIDLMVVIDTIERNWRSESGYRELTAEELDLHHRNREHQIQRLIDQGVLPPGTIGDLWDPRQPEIPPQQIQNQQNVPQEQRVLNPQTIWIRESVREAVHRIQDIYDLAPDDQRTQPPSEVEFKAYEANHLITFCTHKLAMLKWLPAHMSPYASNNEQRTTDAITAGQPTVDVHSSKPQKRIAKQSNVKFKLISALSEHHKYSNGVCDNTNPIGLTALWKKAGVSKTMASTVVKELFGNHAAYQICCEEDPSRLSSVLKAHNGDYTVHDTFGETPPRDVRRTHDDDRRDAMDAESA